jgi:hypothetical protein
MSTSSRHPPNKTPSKILYVLLYVLYRIPSSVLYVNKNPIKWHQYFKKRKKIMICLKISFKYLKDAIVAIIIVCICKFIPVPMPCSTDNP